MVAGMQSRIQYRKEQLRHEREYLTEQLRDDQDLDDEERYYLYRDIDEADRQLALLETC